MTELLASMRFAIALLTLICIASVIGTVIQQHQTPVNYVNQFGPFWAEVFDRLGLYAVYSTAWFLVILAFLVTSTSLCIARNTPKILADLKNYKENVRESSLAAFHHKARGELAVDRAAALAQVSTLLSSGGWKAKAQVRSNGVMVAARQGAANKIGYLAAHSAIVLICIGGLFDGDLVVRAQMLLLGKSSYQGAGLLKDVAPQHRLSPANPTFRGNLFVPEGAAADTAVINLSDGVVLQDLPFSIELKKFIVEYYDTGMPKLFASDIVIHDRDGKTTVARVKVNEPVIHDGIAIYQSSFDDGGSHLTFKALPFGQPGAAFEVKGDVGSSTTLTHGPSGEQLQVEFTGLRVINVENMGAEPSDTSGADTLSKHLGSGARGQADKALRNVGPSVSYKLRDAAGRRVNTATTWRRRRSTASACSWSGCATRPTSRSAICASRPTTRVAWMTSCTCAPRWPTPRSARKPPRVTPSRPARPTSPKWSSRCGCRPSGCWRCLPAPNRPARASRPRPA